MNGEEKNWTSSEKIITKFYCFHDVDVVDFIEDVAENERRLQQITAYAKQKQKDSGVQLLWGTANLCL